MLPSFVLSTHALPVPPPATKSRSPLTSSPTAVVRPSAPPGANGASADCFVLPLKIVPSVVEETKNVLPFSAMPSGKTASPGIV